MTDNIVKRGETVQYDGVTWYVGEFEWRQTGFNLKTGEPVEEWCVHLHNSVKNKVLVRPVTEVFDVEEPTTVSDLDD